MSVKSSPEFLALLNKSKVFEQTDLDEIAKKYAEVHDPRKLAQHLVNDQHLSKWQAKFLLSGRHQLTIGQYLLIERFPANSLGERFLGVHRSLDRLVDISIFPLDLVKNKPLFQKVLDQGTKVAKLDHSNLIHLYDIDQQSNRYFFVFEQDHGESLMKVATGSIDSNRLASIVKQILDGISYAHGHELIHGKLDQSQVRIDANDQVKIRNVGLASVIDRLTGGEADDPYSVTPTALDDLNATGKIGVDLFERHIGVATTSGEKKLLATFTQLSTTTNGSAASHFTTKLESAIQDLTSESALDAGLEPEIVDYSVPSTPPLSDDEVAGSPFAKQNSTRKTTTAAPAKKSIASSRKEGGPNIKVLIATIATCLALLIGGGAWLISSMTKDKDKQNANSTSADEGANEETNEQESNADKSNNKTEKASGKIPQQPTSGGLANQGESSKTPVVNTPIDTELQKNRTSSDLTPAASEIAKALNSAPKSDNVNHQPAPIGSINSSNDMSPAATTSDATMPERNMQEEAANALADGKSLPLISWEDVRDSIGKEVIVFGTVRSVGQSGPFRFMNFKARSDKKSFTIVVNQRDWDISDDALRKKYDEKNVLVRGELTLYERTDTPQISVKSESQLSIVDELPEAAGVMVVAGDGSNPGAALSAATTASGVFGKIPDEADIPELTKTEPNLEKVLIGSVAIGDDPLAIFLTVPTEASDKEIYFDLTRDEQTRRRWDIAFAPRERNKDEKEVVAEILLEEDNLYFQWKSTSDFKPQVNFLRNCLVKFATSSDSKTILLRKPLVVPEIVFDPKRPQFKEKLDLKYLPSPDSITVEFMPVSTEEYPESVNDFGYQLSTAQTETATVFHPLDECQFILLWNAVSISSSITIESAMQLNTDNFPPVTRKGVDNLSKLIYSMQAAKSQEHMAAVAHDPPRGTIMKHRKYTEQVSEELEFINRQVAAFEQMKPIAEKLVAAKFQYRVFFTVDGIEYDLARTAGFQKTDP